MTANGYSYLIKGWLLRTEIEHLFISRDAGRERYQNREDSVLWYWSNGKQDHFVPSSCAAGLDVYTTSMSVLAAGSK